MKKPAPLGSTGFFTFPAKDEKFVLDNDFNME